ncbi:3-phosphoshikimate 1-carboxyvinyltransferase [Proteinivorax tanatarense]|uniref:3-phosphoshikimate 1-carboxyvinyltransferase n=1 Tax=Proteinivorax tanatarense TaxID=1260629 RepID=A0AAU7VPZ9_9FIRM
MLTISKGYDVKNAEYIPAGDKSISHRIAMLAAMSKGSVMIRNFSQAKDCESTLKCIEALGCRIEQKNGLVEISQGKTPEGKVLLDCGNSGTTARLIGVVASFLGIESTIVGDNSLSQRPMNRVVDPLQKFGINIKSRKGKLPIEVIPCNNLSANFNFDMEIASAQVKSAMLLAGLFNKGRLTITQPAQSRDHTEVMLKNYGVDLDVQNSYIIMEGVQIPEVSGEYEVCGDFSSAAFMIAAALVRGFELTIKRVGLNPTRVGFLDILTKMGAKIERYNVKKVDGELTGNIKVFPSKLVGVTVSKELVANAIDELPLVAVLGAFAEGTTKVIDAKELRYKESDRIKSTVTNLSKLGADIEEIGDGFTVKGITQLKGTTLNCHKDHRIIMSMAVAALGSLGETKIEDSKWVNISNSQFFEELKKMVPGSVTKA